MISMTLKRPPVPTGVAIKGFGGTRTTGVSKGTLLWSWEDDDGKKHDFWIPNSYCVPSEACRLLSPQHWSQTQRDKVQFGTGCKTDGRAAQLYWKNWQYQLTVPLGDKDNVATF
jgi:hypothetical protein